MMKNRTNGVRPGRPRSTSARRGFTLIEVIVAVTVLAGVVLTMSMNTTKSSRNVATSGTRSRAQALLDQQIARARIWPTYGTLSQLTGAQYNVANNGLTPTTTISIDTTSNKNLTTVTVTVTGAASVLPTAMSRSISIAAP